MAARTSTPLSVTVARIEVAVTLLFFQLFYLALEPDYASVPTTGETYIEWESDGH